MQSRRDSPSGGDSRECPPDVVEAVARALAQGDFAADRLRTAVTVYAQRERASGETRDHAVAQLRRCVVAAIPVAFVIDEVGELWLNLLYWVFGVYYAGD